MQPNITCFCSRRFFNYKLKKEKRQIGTFSILHLHHLFMKGLMQTSEDENENKELLSTWGGNWKPYLLVVLNLVGKFHGHLQCNIGTAWENNILSLWQTTVHAFGCDNSKDNDPNGSDSLRLFWIGVPRQPGISSFDSATTAAWSLHSYPAHHIETCFKPQEVQDYQVI